MTVLLFLLAACGLLYAYMRYEFDNILVSEVELGFPDIKIAFASDFQYDMRPRNPSSVRTATLQKAVDMLNGQGADIILLGGDYSTYTSNWETAVPYLSQLQAPLGVYAVFGNHDIDDIDRLIQALPNIRFLRNEIVHIPVGDATLAITGVEDLWTGKPTLPQSEISTDDYNILLSHNPDFFQRLAGRNPFDLVLSGHTHAGQATLFGRGLPPLVNHVTDYGEKYRYGEKIYEGKRIYITSGLGGSALGFPLRFGAPPEIVVLQQEEI